MKMVAAGRDFAGRFLTGAAVDHYLLAVLDRYATAAGAATPGPPGRGLYQSSGIVRFSTLIRSGVAPPRVPVLGPGTST